MNENLSTLSLDVEKGELKVNGKDMSDVSYFKLEFNGAWSLTISEDFYVTGKKRSPENSGDKIKGQILK